MQGYPAQALLNQTDFFSDNNEINFTVAVENGTDYGFRIQIWQNFLNRYGVLKNKTKILTRENLLVDSLEEEHTFHTKGQGINWGLKLSRSTLIEGSRISPNVY